MKNETNTTLEIEEVESYLVGDDEAEEPFKAVAPSSFVIKDDNTADWALRKIKESLDLCERVVAIGEAQIEEIKSRIDKERRLYENKTAYLKSKLLEYFQTVEHQTTKTEEKYKLFNGTLKMKKPAQKLNHDDDALGEWLAQNGYAELLKSSPKWAEAKKLLEIGEGGIVTIKDTGEVVGGVTVTETPAEFDVKF